MPDRPLSALVLGSARNLAAERAEALELFEPALIIAANHAGRDEPGRLDHWCTMHSDLMAHWLAERLAGGRPAPGHLWHPRHRASAPEGSRAIESWGGSSGLLCVAVAFELDVERIVLAGMPMLKNERHFDNDKPWIEARQYWPAWERHADRMRPRVRSLSGWTRDLLGSPSREWLSGKA